MKTKFAIGCLVQWYECDIIGEYVESLKDAIKNYGGEVIVDFTIITNEDLEKCINTKKKDECIEKIKNTILDFENIRSIKQLHTIADYRREFNDKYCEHVDVLVWGESDMLAPQQMFTILDSLHQNTSTPKYLATFGTCKMWDDTWKPLEHSEFTNHKHSDDPNDWWGLNYVMGKKEMDNFNNKVEELTVTQITPHKFNGCGLVISSEVIKSGVNIPRSIFFVHEDTAFMLMTQKILGNIPQYHFKNILLVHNRKRMDKRVHVKGEYGKTMGQLRESNKWYQVSNQMCEKNCYSLFDPNYKSFTWKDVWAAQKN